MISKRQRDVNNDLAAYLDRRLERTAGTSGSFFKKVDSIIPRRSSSFESVPRVDSNNSTVYERPRKSFLWFFSIRTKRPKLDDDLSEDVKEELTEMEEDIEEIDEEVEELETHRESLLTRFFNLLRGGRRASSDEDDIPEDLVREAMGDEAAAEELQKETQEVLKVIHKWLGRLPPEEINAFKRSSDFNRYKDLLDQYGLIK